MRPANEPWSPLWNTLKRFRAAPDVLLLLLRVDDDALFERPMLGVPDEPEVTNGW